jgi:uncharacterized membrane protein YeiB
MQQQTLQPVAIQERIQTIDILRAFALFGVVVANFTVDNQDVAPDEGRTGFFDQLVYWPIRFFIDDKAMSMYCFLFGLGFAIQLLRSEERKISFVFTFIRRMIVLFIIGVIALSLSAETIPHEYAMVGLLLLIFYKLPWKILPILALLCVLVPFTRDLIIRQKTAAVVSSSKEITIDTALLNNYVGVYENDSRTRMIIEKDLDTLFYEVTAKRFRLSPISDSEFVRRETNHRFSFHKDSTGGIGSLVVVFPSQKRTIYRKINTDLQAALKNEIGNNNQVNGVKNKPSYKQFVVNTATDLWNGFRNWSWKKFFWGSAITDILSYFLIGLYVGRRRIFYDVAGNKGFLEKVKWWGFIIGTTGMLINLGWGAWNFIYGIPFTSYPIITRLFVNLSWSLGVMAMTFAYVAALTLLLQNDKWKKKLAFLAPVGRMGLTNYLLHVIPYVVLFHYGFDLSGKIGPFYRLLLALPVYAGLIFLSHWWFKHFRIGPAEWLWRSLTYLKFQPMRLKLPDEKAAIQNINI